MFDGFTGLKNVFRKDEELDMGRGIGSNGPSKVRSGRFDDDDATSPITLGIRGAQIFFLLISLFIIIAIAAFQSKNGVGPSGLTGLDIFVIVLSLLVTTLFLVVPILHDRHGWLKTVAQMIRQIRFGLISHGIMCTILLIVALTNAISANTAGCRNPDNDPHADLEGYKDKLGGFCQNKRALTAFLFFSLFAWVASLYFVVRNFLDVRRGKGSSSRIPGFVPPHGDDDAVFDVADERGPYDQPDMGYAPRPSATYYSGERPFEGNVPAGYSSPAPQQQRPDSFRDPPQYPGNQFTNPYAPEDPYERIRASMALRDDSLTPRQTTPAPQLPPITTSHPQDPFRG